MQSVSLTGATLTATVQPRGQATKYWFQYGPNTGYHSRTGAIGAGSGTQQLTVTASLSGLIPSSTIHYRVVASHCQGCARGTMYGADASFTVGGYRNPVFSAAQAADPFVLDNGGTHNDYWAFTTGDGFPLLHSRDLVHWTGAGTAMRSLPSWVVQSGDWHPWAPSVVRANEPCPHTGSPSCYVMYYVGLSARFGANCVAVATATTPGGPYTDQGPLSNGTLDASGRPVGCGDDHGFGQIDPSPFVDPGDGQAYLYVSEDFACPGAGSSCTRSNGVLQPTISVIPLASDYLQAAGARVPLFSGAAGGWEALGTAVPTVEGPAMVFHNGLYYLLYSGGSWLGAYGMGYALGSSPTGPFAKAGPLLAQTATVLGPGGGDDPVIGPGGGTWLVYHGREGSNSVPRTLQIAPLVWRPQTPAPDAPQIGGPTDTPQALQP